MATDHRSKALGELPIPIPRHVYGDPEVILAEASAMIADHLCAVWDWLPDEEEALVLGDQLAAALFRAVEGTGTQPMSLLQALLHPRPSEFHRGADTVLIREN